MLKRVETALLLIDIQMEFAHRTAAGIPRTTPEAESNIAETLAVCREKGVEVIHIHHHSLDSESPFQAHLPGSEVQSFAQPTDSESVYIKHVNSAFIGTSLESDLHQKGIKNLLFCGGTANHCVETSVRMAGNLGFNAYYLSDCVWAYGAVGPDGKEHLPENILSVTLANLQTEFAQILSFRKVLPLLD